MGLILNTLGRSWLLTVIKKSFILRVVRALNLPLSFKLKYFIEISKIKTQISTLMDDPLVVVQISTFRQYVTYYPMGTVVFMTSSVRLKKVTMSYNQTRRLHNVWKKTSDVLKTLYLRPFKDDQFITSWRRLFYGVLKTSGLQCLVGV